MYLFVATSMNSCNKYVHGNSIVNCFRLSAPHADILYDINISLFTQSFDWPSFIKHIWSNFHVKADLMCWIFIMSASQEASSIQSSFTTGRVQCTRSNVWGVCTLYKKPRKRRRDQIFNPCIVSDPVLHFMLRWWHLYINAVLETIWWQWTLCRHCNLNTRRVSC